MLEITLNQLPQDLQQLIEEITRTNQSLTITEAGVPLAILSPLPKQKRAPFGCMRNTMEILDDIVIPAVPESEWQVLQ